jgi:hypothetical protein
MEAQEVAAEEDRREGGERCDDSMALRHFILLKTTLHERYRLHGESELIVLHEYLSHDGD